MFIELHYHMEYLYRDLTHRPITDNVSDRIYFASHVGGGGVGGNKLNFKLF